MQQEQYILLIVSIGAIFALTVAIRLINHHLYCRYIKQLKWSYENQELNESLKRSIEVEKYEEWMRSIREANTETSKNETIQG